MTRTLALLLTMILSGVAASQAADNPVVGKWSCTSQDVSGQENNWTLTVKEDGSKLAGALSAADGAEIPLIDPRLEGNLFTFKIDVNANCKVEAQVKIDGKKFEGKFACAEASGTLKGSKQI